MPTSSRMVVGVFDDYAAAQRAADDLVNNGFMRESIDVRANERFADAASGNARLTGREPRDASGGGIAGFFRRLFGADEEYSSHYEEAIRRGGAIVGVNTDNEDLAAEVLDRNGAVDIDERADAWREQGYTGSTASKPEIERSRTGDRTMPVVREELQVGKRDVLRGGVRVYNRVEEQPVEEQVHLREEHVRVDRRPANRPATDADLRAHDEVIEVTERAEVPVVNKTARVVEEVVVGKETTQRTENIKDTIRRSDVKVERLGAERGAVPDDDDFRRDFQTRYGAMRGEKYEAYAPAYQYGYRMASDDRYRGRKWDEVESDLQYEYERNYPGSTWDKMKDSIRYGWEKVTGRR